MRGDNEGLCAKKPPLQGSQTNNISWPALNLLSYQALAFEDTDGMANSVVPDQTAPTSAMSAQTYMPQYLEFFMVPQLGSYVTLIKLCLCRLYIMPGYFTSFLWVFQ